MLSNLPLTQQSIDKAVGRALETVREIDAANFREDKLWRDELEQLERRFQCVLTIDQAKDRAQAVEREQNSIVKAIETEIAEGLKLIETPYLSLLEQRGIKRHVESLESSLIEAKRVREREIRRSGALINDAKTWAPFRPRYEELKKRARDLERATARIR